MKGQKPLGSLSAQTRLEIGSRSSSQNTQTLMALGEWIKPTVELAILT
jgi:hypothetical protein